MQTDRPQECVWYLAYTSGVFIGHLVYGFLFLAFMRESVAHSKLVVLFQLLNSVLKPDGPVVILCSLLSVTFRMAWSRHVNSRAVRY